jgi:hypothetical protein
VGGVLAGQRHRTVRDVHQTVVVDEIRLVVAPNLAGRERRLIDGLPALRFESIQSTTSPTGSLLLGYRALPA